MCDIYTLKRIERDEWGGTKKKRRQKVITKRGLNERGREKKTHHWIHTRIPHPYTLTKN